MSSTTKLRISQSLPVHIVEQHNDVVPFVHRAIASKLLPYSGISMLHFDSHPDLLIPINIQADVVFTPQLLYESISIENWLLPLAYAKHFDQIVWVKPPWAHQIKTPEQMFTIGKCTASGKMRLTSKENYFLTEGLFCPAKDLADTNDVKLAVVELLPENWAQLETNSDISDDVRVAKNNPENNEEPRNILIENNKLVTNLQKMIGNKAYVLDIDLDFFSTANPFRNMLRPDEEQALRRLYHYPSVTDFTDESIAAFTQTREKQINQLEVIFTDLETKWFVDKPTYSKMEIENYSLTDFTGKDNKDFICFNCQQQEDLTYLCRSLLDNPDREVTFIVLHYFGCTLDDTELPHHISTPEQVRALQDSLKTVLEHLPKPTLVTIARSSEDGYCPKEVVDQCQIEVLKILEDLYGTLKISKSYE